ncbi:permease [Salicibibacter cibarius]|uniref:Permease n=1 Tax=Salicibibacter cibarius TaxID=2743000 RepID=A0A7T6Z589_9BACI|nr:permease [Salicibibacter cibarius]QQK77048.1 permease [Salicibibacter cibarius]
MKKQHGGTFLKDSLGILILFLFFAALIFAEPFQALEEVQAIPASWLQVHSIFISIVLEAFPFLLMGVLFSSIVQVFVKEDWIHRVLPRSPMIALFPATMVGILLPICECAVVPVVRRLISKGLPLHLGVVIMMSMPILNPIVGASTFFAFQNNLSILYWRMGLALVLSILIGGIVYRLLKNQQPLRSHPSVHHACCQHDHGHSQHRLSQGLYHAVDEFFMIGKYFIIGAFIASVFQTFFDRQLLFSIGDDAVASTIAMMGLAYLLSLCAEADAFVAASFGSTFTNGSLLAFLVYGPMIDLKNTIMMIALFKTRVVFVVIGTTTVIVFTAIMILQPFL